MATMDELKRKLCEAEETLQAARGDAERQRWAEIVQEWREAIKQKIRIDGGSERARCSQQPWCRKARPFFRA
jgi:hypothetical protein